MQKISVKSRGFTIVELLIVIVVIAVLAAITVVAFNGVQNRSYDSAIQADLRAFGQKNEIFKAENGKPVAMTDVALDALNWQASKRVYGDVGNNQALRSNLGYCVNTTTDEYVLYAFSPSGKAFRYHSSNGVREHPILSGGFSICDLAGVATTNPNWARSAANNTWKVWSE